MMPFLFAASAAAIGVSVIVMVALAVLSGNSRHPAQVPPAALAESPSTTNASTGATVSPAATPPENDGSRAKGEAHSATTQVARSTRTLPGRESDLASPPPEDTSSEGEPPAESAPSDSGAPVQDAPAPEILEASASAPESTIARAARPSPSSAAASAVPFKDWTQLRYTTSKMVILTGEVKMSRSVAGNKITLRTDTQARLFGAALVNAWSIATKDRATGRPLEFLDVRPGKRAERWTFLDHSIVCTVLKPNEKQKNAPLEAWRVTKTRTFPIKDAPSASTRETLAAPAGSPVMSVSLTPAEVKASPGTAPAAKPGGRDASRWVYDYMTMVASLADFPLNKVGDVVTALVSTSDGPVPVTIRVMQERTNRRTMTDLSTGKSRSIDLREFRLSVSPPSGSTAQKDDYMKDDTELWVEATTRTFTELSGRFKGVPGRIDLVLAGYR